MRPAVKPTEGTEYWEYVLLYVDDALCIPIRPQEILDNEIGRYWTIKKCPVGDPNI